MKSVLGGPIHANGKTIAAVAKVAYGFGGGFGTGRNAQHPERQGEGGGGGGRRAGVTGRRARDDRKRTRGVVPVSAWTCGFLRSAFGAGRSSQPRCCENADSADARLDEVARALPQIEDGRFVHRWSVDDPPILERELGAVPRADHRPVLQRAFGEGPSEVRTGVGKRAHMAVLRATGGRLRSVPRESFHLR